MRQVEAIPVDTERGRLVQLRDPLGFSPVVLHVSQEVFYIITLLNGTRDIRDVQARVMRQYGQLIYTEKIEELIEQLDSCHFLDNERFAALEKKTIEEFLESPTRPASHAGAAYSPNAPDLTREIERMFATEDGPREINWEKVQNTIRGLVVPHIDFVRGSEAYGPGYAELAENSRAETYVVLGTAHCEMKKPFCLTLKDFETPLGTLENDRNFGEELLARCPWLTEDEFAHRSEHSIEFQALFLQYLFGRRRSVKIVPVLCGAFHRNIGKTDPLENKEIREFIEALKEAVSKRGDSACIIAGADLSHVGPSFGDPQPVNARQLDYIRELDTKTLKYVQKVDADGFYRDVTEDGDRRNICGLPNIYTMLSVLGEGKGRLIKYLQAVDRQTASVVTFASVVIEK
jgi:AmmeMemoRadiSam system protein B